MEEYKKKFIEFMVRSNVLTFGDFTTKSGRKTPFFINTGNYNTGKQMHQLGLYYAEALQAKFGTDFDVIFGPAYKGIPLVVTTSIALSSNFNQDINFSFNRKEAKDHGERGSLIGYKLKDGDRVIIVEDVTTAGTSVRESVPLLKSIANVKVVGLIVSVDRMEKGTTDRGALSELQDEFGLESISIVNLDEIVEYLYNRPIDGKIVVDDKINNMIKAYRSQYGAK